jgi:hypothetical protein
MPKSIPPSTTKGTTSVAASQSRKRSRSKGDPDASIRERLASVHGLDLPTIRGVPLEVIPLYLHALKVTARYIQQSRTIRPDGMIPPFSVSDEGDRNLARAINDDDVDLSLAKGHKMHKGSIHHEDDSDVMESILNRMKQSSAQKQQSENPDFVLLQQKESAKNKAVQTWLESLHRSVRNAKPSNISFPAAANSTFHLQSPSTLIVVATCRHLWDLSLGISSESPSSSFLSNINARSWMARRASWHLLGHLALRSAQARHWILGSEMDSNPNPASTDQAQPQSYQTRWLNWTEPPSSISMSSSVSAMPSTDHWNRDQTEYFCLQQEAYALLYRLELDGYSRFYPSISVLQRRLLHSCPPLVHTIPSIVTLSTTKSPATLKEMSIHDATFPGGLTMVEARQCRDQALAYGAQEEQRVRKLLIRCDKDMEILVPRFGFGEGELYANNVDSSRAANDALHFQSETPTVSEKHIVTNDQPDKSIIGFVGGFDENDDDMDDDVDWEDGSENNHSVVNDTTVDTETHADAVERTMAVLEATGRWQDGTGLTIDLSRNTDKDDDHPTHTTSNIPESAHVTRARARLQKCVQRLWQRHFPRLSQWTQGLRCADHLIAAKSEMNGMSTAYVSMTREQQRHRQSVLDRLTLLQNEVRKTLAAARKIGITEAGTSNEVSVESTSVNTTAASTSSANRSPFINHPPHRTTLGNGSRRPSSFHRSQGRVQIKLTKK